MLDKPARIELSVILGALLAALVFLVYFWATNRGPIPPSSYRKTTAAAPANLTPLANSALITSSQTGQPVTVPTQGLTKLLGPTTVKALILGDSIAFSRGASNQDLDSWFALVSKDLHAQYPGTLQWQLQTSAEGTINDALNDVPTAKQDNDLIVICLGRNDCRTIKLTEFKKKYEQLLVELKAKNPRADIFLVAEPPVRDIPENNRYFPYRGVTLNLAQKYQLPVIDAWTSFIQDPAQLTDLLSNNSEPNDKGYRVFAAAVLKSFADYFSPVK
ncbi:MAG: SGNH/GDSL hydrolase family protein [Desulfosporosinus sp.]|nr:SGNH/GDSL hydrolase family protein [Desulfosporosinus sp.]